MTDVERCEINVTVGNSHNIECDLKKSVNMKFKDVQTVKLTKILYVPQAVKNLLSVSRLVPKGSTMGATQEKITIDKNGVSAILDARKVQKKSMMFYFKAKRNSSEVKESLTNLPEEKNDSNDEK